MANARDLFSSIRTALESGTAPLAELGKGPAGNLNLDEPGGLERYAEILRPQIQLTLRRNKGERKLLIVLLIVLFVAATAIVVYDHLHGAGPKTSLLIVPGLGMAAVWPVQSLIALHRQAMALEVFPGMIPLLTRQQAARLAEQFLSRGLTWDIGTKAARSSR
jgi:hypothetical protein